jgi:hypothetical protein
MERRLLTLLTAVMLVACGGTDDGRPSGEAEGASVIDPCLVVPDAYEFQNVVDFEPRMIGDNVSLFATCEAPIACTFYFNYDVAQSPENPDVPLERGPECLEKVVPNAVAFTEPRVMLSQFVGAPLEGGRCGEETSGLSVITENVGMCYGPDGRLGWGAALDITFSPALDASEWDGLALWVKNASSETEALNVAVADPYTSGMPYCNSMDPPPGAPPVPDTEKCDAFGTAVTMTGEWSFVPARFSAMRQKGFGVPSELGHLDTTSLSRIQLLISAGSSRFFVDDISLSRDRE